MMVMMMMMMMVIHNDELVGQRVKEFQTGLVNGRHPSYRYARFVFSLALK